MTCNQLMVLLDIYRGTFNLDRHLGTVWDDVAYLYRQGLITAGQDTTSFGDAHVRHLLDTKPRSCRHDVWRAVAHHVNEENWERVEHLHKMLRDIKDWESLP